MGKSRQGEPGTPCSSILLCFSRLDFAGFSEVVSPVGLALFYAAHFQEGGVFKKG